MFRLIIVSFVLIVLVTGAALAQDAAEERRLYVGPNRVICTGVGPQLCLQVKDSPEGEYTLFYSMIEGFDYQPGFDYELLVSVTEVENPPADASSLEYTLVEVISMSRSLEHNQWLLDSYVNADGETVMVLPDDVAITLAIRGNEVSGSAGCNFYFGVATIDGTAINISEIGSTLMLCAPDALMNQETDYLAILATVATYEIEDDQLHLSNAAGDIVLTFAVNEPEALVGTTWVLTSYLVGGDAVAPALPDVEVTAQFDAEGSLKGSAGCNTYSASVTIGDGFLSIGPAVSTRMACAPESVMGQESAYLTALENIIFYQIRADELHLLDANGNVLLSFQAKMLENE